MRLRERTGDGRGVGEPRRRSGLLHRRGRGDRTARGRNQRGRRAGPKCPAALQRPCFRPDKEEEQDRRHRCERNDPASGFDPWRPQHSETTAPATANVHVTVRTSSQPDFPSEPVPSPCMTATGHDRYASQCTARQPRKPIRARSKLVATSASKRSKATVPSRATRPGTGRGRERRRPSRRSGRSRRQLSSARARRRTRSRGAGRCDEAPREACAGARAERAGHPEHDGSGQEHERDDARAARRSTRASFGGCSDHAASASVRGQSPTNTAEPS